jgi:hypothetical protein
LFILYHSTLLKYPFWPLLHYFAYSLPFNITTIPFLASTSLFCLFCTIQHYYNTLFGHCFTILFILYHSTLLQYPFWPLLHYFAYSLPFNITTIPFLVSTSLFCLYCNIQHYYNTFIWSLLHYFVYSVPFNITTTPFWTLLHYFVYSVPFNITTIPLFGLYFTILFILYHSTLLQYLFLVSTSLFCLLCTIQHYYNTFFWSLLHYFVYSVPFNITTIPFLGLYFTILFILYHSTLLQYLF